MEPSNCECGCDKSCDVSEYLDYENCKCRKKMVDKLIEECTKNIDEAKIAGMALFEHRSVCMFLHNLCCLSNQHWNWCLFSLFLLVLKKKMLLMLNL